MSCPIRKSQRNGWRCFCKSSATPVRGSSWRHSQVSIKLHRNAEALNLRLFNSGAEQPRKWKSFSNDSRPAVTKRLTSHHSWPVRCPRRHCRSLFVACAVAVSIGIFRRPNRIAARVRHRHANFRPRFALDRYSAESRSGGLQSAGAIWRSPFLDRRPKRQRSRIRSRARSDHRCRT